MDIHVNELWQNYRNVNDMIPKIIHYIWFGRNHYSDKINKCIESWHKYLPEYEFKLWNEDTFNIEESCDFVKQAYSRKKWAFVSDYVRIWALNNYGGIYLDTDVEVCKPMDKFLDYRMVLGTDERGNLTAFMASETGHPLWRHILDIYHSMQFLLPDGSLNINVNNFYIETKLKELGYKTVNQKQELREGIMIFSDEWFHAADHMTGNLHITDNTHAIHWHTLTWCDRSTHINRFLRVKVLGKFIGGELANKLFTFLHNLKKK